MRDQLIRAKFWFYRYSGLITTAVVGGAGIIASVHIVSLPVAATAVVSVLGIAFGVQKQKLSEFELFYKLFKEFNERYGQLDERLRNIAALTGEDPPTDDERDTVIRYFNLCAEEFFYYTHGYVHPEAWTSWLRGMEELLCSPRILVIWRQEFKKGSYYGLEAQAPFSLLPPSSPGRELSPNTGPRPPAT